MNEVQYQRLLGACRLLHAMGGRVTCGTWEVQPTPDDRWQHVEEDHFGKPQACALGALMLCEQPTPERPPVNWANLDDIRALTAAKMMSTNSTRLAWFLRGFDGRQTSTLGASKDLVSWYDAGRRLWRQCDREELTTWPERVSPHDSKKETP